MRYADWLPGIAPAWLKDPQSEAFLKALGLSFDATAERLRAATRARFLGPSVPSAAAVPGDNCCPNDALDAHARDRNLERYPGHTDSTLRAYLRAAWDTWLGAGTYPGMVAALEAAGFPGAVIYDSWASGSGGTGHPSWWPGGAGAWPPAPPGPRPSWWSAVATSFSVSTAWPPAAGSDAARVLASRWWLEIPPRAGWTLRRWDDGSEWDDGGLWGINGASVAADVELLLRVVHKFRAAAGPLEFVFVRFPDEPVLRSTSSGDVRTTSDGSFRRTSETEDVIVAIPGA